MAAATTAPMTLAPSALAYYFHLNCDVFLRREARGPWPPAADADAALPPAATSRTGAQAAAAEPRQAWLAALMDRGNAFEAEVVAGLRARPDAYVVLDAADQAPADALADAVQAAQAAGPGKVVAVHHWRVPAACANELWPLAGGAVRWTRMEADLLLCRWDAAAEGGGVVRVTVVDIKASHALKLYHQVQVAVYAEVLSRLVGAAKPALVARLQLAPVGEVWRPGDARDRFPLAPLRARLVELLDGPLAATALNPATATAPVAWDMLPRCAQCKYASDCAARTLTAPRPTLNRVANLGRADVAWLREHTETRWDGAVDIEDVAVALPALRAADETRARRVLALQPEPWPTARSANAPPSALLEAARTGQPAWRGVPSLALPQQEHVCVTLAVVTDPATDAIVAFAAAVRPTAALQRRRGGAALARTLAGLSTSGTFAADADNDLAVAHALAELVAGVQNAVGPTTPATGTTTVQMYTFSEAERARLVRALVHATLAAAASRTTARDALEACALTLMDTDAAAVALATPPALDDATALRCPRLVSVATAVHALYVVPTPGYFTLDDVAHHFLRTDAPPTAPARERPAVADAAAALADTLANQLLLAPPPATAVNDDAIWAAWRAGPDGAAARDRVHERVQVLADVVDAVRAHVLATAARVASWPPDRVLPVAPRPLLPAAAWRLQRPVLRKLAFLQRFDQADQARQLWQDRVLRTGTVVELAAPTDGMWWPVLAGAELASSPASSGNGEARVAAWLLFAVPSAGYSTANTALPDAAVDDLRWCGVHAAQAASAFARRGIFLVDIVGTAWRTCGDDGRRRQLFVSLAGPTGAKARPAPAPGSRWALRPRLVDFNTDKVLACLAALDDGTGPSALPAVVRMLDEPLRLASTTPAVAAGPLRTPDGHEPTPLGRALALYDRQELRALAGAPAALGMNPMQRTVFEWLRTHGLTVVWGPPGTGKTAFLAGAVVRLLHLAHVEGRPLRVFVTAFTTAAIDNLVVRLRSLLAAVDALPPEVKAGVGLPTAHALVDLADDVLELRSGDQQRTVEQRLRRAGPRTIVASTAWQLHKWRSKLADTAGVADRLRFDLVVVDEASQLSVPAAAVALQGAVATGGRIVLAGDPMQLQPIVKAAFPVTRAGVNNDEGARLDASILQSVLRHPTTGAPLALDDLLPGATATSSAQLPPYLFMLHTTHRCNGPLTQLAQRIYGGVFQAADAARDRRLPLRRQPAALPPSPLHASLTTLVREQRRSMVTVRLSAPATAALRRQPYAEQAAAEARLVAGICAWLAAHHDAHHDAERTFVATPHRAQRAAIEGALQALGPAHPFTVDTVERLQGREADAVVAAYLFVDPLRLGQEAGFVFSVQRLNVAFTRARMLCILVVGDAVCEPPLEVLAAPELRAALDLIHTFVAASPTVAVDEATLRAP